MLVRVLASEPITPARGWEYNWPDLGNGPFAEAEAVQVL